MVLTDHTYNIFTYSLHTAKLPLCMMVAFSSLFGFCYGASTLNGSAIAVYFAVLLLSCGAATFNSYQERKEDGFMSRTSGRPLVLKKISHSHALLQASLLTMAGLIWLIILDTASFFAGLVGLILYNLIYTRLKRETLLAIIPGAVCGAVPPYIGWLAAGGEHFSYQAMLPVLLLIFWQVPHFFLVLLNHKDDYMQSISPNILREISEAGVRRVFLPWITAFVTAMLTFAVLPSDIGNLGRVLIVINAVVLLGVFYYELLVNRIPQYGVLFRYLNISIFAVMFIVCLSAGV